MRKAISLRPGTTRYHLALADLWMRIGRVDEGAREHYRGWDLHGRGSQLSLHESGRPARDPEPPDSLAPELKVVVFSDGSPTQLAEFLRAAEAQGYSGTYKVIVVESGGSNRPDALRDVRRTYGGLASFVTFRELDQFLCANAAGRADPCVIVATSTSCQPPTDWLATLAAYLRVHPEAQLFHGSCQPTMANRAGIIQRVSQDLGFYPRAASEQGLLYFAHAANWACTASLLQASGGFTDRRGDLLGLWTLTERALRAGGSCLNAPEWQTQFRMDATLRGLWRRFYWDSFYAARHAIATDDSGAIETMFSPHGLSGSVSATWKFAQSNLRVWRYGNPSALLSMPIMLLLLSLGIARQVGWHIGNRQSSRPERNQRSGLHASCRIPASAAAEPSPPAGPDFLRRSGH
jgi:hypothetical protein